ncbi:MAG: DUF6984 family protein [Clostridium baratii]
MSNRKLTIQEKKLIEFLIHKSSINFPPGWDKDIFVCPMNDGDMGSLYLYSKETIGNDRKFGKQISEAEFKDKDGVVVIASLNLDQNGDLYELDIWKLIIVD